MTDVTLKELLEAGVHFGHQTRRWNPKMKPFIFIERNGIYILDLQKTLVCIQEARKAVERVVRGGRTVLFVGTKRQAKDVIAEEARRCNMYYVNERWFGGLLTNFQTIRRRADYYEELVRMREEGKFALFSKKEALGLEKESLKLQKVLSGVVEMRELPGLVFVVDTKKEHLAVKEANRLGIPVVGIVDTNSDPDPINYPIPGNDDAIRSIRLITQRIAETVLECRQRVDKEEDAPARGQGAAGASA
ncbi:MAG: 30S ribosomal protein S2 [Candidatus Latescibacterota bacterium]|nr:MAG: 30S ribosomal protein S2 [Candidatus Latescibacterota bacterium]